MLNGRVTPLRVIFDEVAVPDAEALILSVSEYSERLFEAKSYSNVKYLSFSPSVTELSCSSSMYSELGM